MLCLLAFNFPAHGCDGHKHGAKKSAHKHSKK